MDVRKASKTVTTEYGNVTVEKVVTDFNDEPGNTGMETLVYVQHTFSNNSDVDVPDTLEDAEDFLMDAAQEKDILGDTAQDYDLEDFSFKGNTVWGTFVRDTTR